jgi:hypothetical protein
MINSPTINIKKYKENYLSCYIMKGGWTYCFKCAIEEEEDDIIAQKLLWNSQDINCRCDRCSKRIADVN